MPKKKLSSLKVTDGKFDAEDSEYEVFTIDQLLGDDGGWKYGTLNEKEYIASLEEKNLSDLQRHATEVGLIPISDRKRLSQRLVRAFLTHAAQYKIPRIKKNKQVTIDKELKEILDSGK